MKVGWRRDSVASVGESLTQKLTRALWYIDPHHDKFVARGIQLPPHLGTLEGYNDYKRKKERVPQLSAVQLNEHVQELSALLMQPWFTIKRFELLRQEVEGLVGAMHKYCEYLRGKDLEIKKHHQSPEPAQGDDNASLITLPVTSGPVLSEYGVLEEKLRLLPMYEPIFVNEYAPEDRYSRRNWFAKLALPYPTCMYRYAYGNNLGTLTYIWKIPEGPLDQTAVSRVFMHLTNQQQKYSTRAMRLDFLQKYNRLAKIPKSVLRNIYHTE